MTMLDFQIPQITHEQVSDVEGQFVVEPLNRGFGYTFGNSLRRVLLSSLEGAAVTSIRIDGVAHEFSTVPGVREDVTDVILNLKGLVCILHGETSEIEAEIVREGEGVVTAGDIAASSELEVLNPDLVICHVAAGSRLEMSLTIGRGRGYTPAQGNKSELGTIGVIPVDSIFSPVRRVTYHVEPARLGQRTDYDKLTLDVKTDGSVNPKDAVTQAAEILIRQLAIFTTIDTDELTKAELPRTFSGTDAPAPQAHGMENILIEELELGVRSYNCLKRVGIETIGDLVSKTEQELQAIPNFGKKSVEELKEALASHALYLRGGGEE
jgi:DNA-directed RNA polymerase subunit alpha